MRDPIRERQYNSHTDTTIDRFCPDRQTNRRTDKQTHKQVDTARATHADMSTPWQRHKVRQTDTA